MSSTGISGGRHDLTRGQRLPDLLRVQVRVHPGRVAAVHADRRLTYRQLDRLSSGIAACLRHHGAGPDDRVGVFVEPSLDLVTGIWGVLYAGAAYLPLPPEYPEGRLRHMVEDAQVRIIICQEHLRERLAELVPPGTVVVTEPDAARFAPTHLPTVADLTRDVRPDHLAYVIYTSGSTGRPKGVMIEHRSIVNQLQWLRDASHLGRERVVLQKTPMGFDAAQWEILASAYGSTVAVGPPGVYRDPERLIDTIIAHRATTLQCVPTLLKALLDTERFGRCASLAEVFSGGEALSGSLARACLDELPWCRLINLYGPTECTINSSAFVVRPDRVPDGPQSVSIGTPVANTRYYILDDERHPVAAGQVAELYVGGVQVARGYLNRPDLTAERFIDDPQRGRLFRTGDLAYWNTDATVQFVGRADNQVKLRGFRIELDEIRLAIETHDWVRQAAVIVQDDPRTGFQDLVACVELSSREAALMDQGNHVAHHQSKQSRLQVMAQLSDPGLREAGELAGRAVVVLPGKEPLPRQRRQAFARKTYRFFEGGPVSREDMLRLLERRVRAASPRDPADVGLAELGEILRYFGQYRSAERLLPKYGYASPGALYATQLYVELPDVDEVPPGLYYYHPAHHQLVLISEVTGAAEAPIRIHFLGKRRAIEPVYKNNIQEVLEIEAGHMIGLFEEVLPTYGLDVRSLTHEPAVKTVLDSAEEDHYLGTFTVGQWTPRRPQEQVEIYVQAHPGKVAGMPPGQYRYHDGVLSRISDQLILRKHVIAINQEVYTRASGGITVVSRAREQWRQYLDLGRTLQHLQMNDVGLGFMSSGYSSRTGHDLPSARRIDQILATHGLPAGPSYFFVGGRVSEQQQRSEGMKEDTVHMKGPAEMIRDDLVKVVPDYMVPNRVVVFDALPLSANGKVDLTALAASERTRMDLADRPYVAPHTPTQHRVARLWRAAMKLDTVSIRDDFFASGGNSLVAVGLINKLNREFGTQLPLQVLFESPTVEALARRVEAVDSEPPSRVVPLRSEGVDQPVFCWPGLGGYAMNLRPLVGVADVGRPFYGVQAYGINRGELPYRNIGEMVAADTAEIRRVQPAGPYTLWGYSIGARIAYEVAHQLERAGERVDSLCLIAPGSPRVDVGGDRDPDGVAASLADDFADRAFAAILFSVFAGDVGHPALTGCLRLARDEASFVSFISDYFQLDRELVARVTAVARLTFGMRYDLGVPAERPVHAPITIFRAPGDEPSPVEGGAVHLPSTPVVIDLDADHYRVLKASGIAELARKLRPRPGTEIEEAVVPHVNIKHFPTALTDQQQADLVAAVTDAVRAAFSCDERVISIALEPVAKEVWHDRVYVPEIVNRKDLLRKVPSY